MKNGNGSTILLLILIVLCAIFVKASGHAMPPLVASHFDARGAANAFMPRESYINFMLVIVAGVPLLLVAVPRMALAAAGERINLPNRDYWLAPERRDQTIAFMHGHTARFGIVLVVFLAYVHWLVVGANQLPVPRLPSVPFMTGLGLFFVCAIVWARSFFTRFGRAPR